MRKIYSIVHLWLRSKERGRTFIIIIIIILSMIIIFWEFIYTSVSKCCKGIVCILVVAILTPSLLLLALLLLQQLSLSLQLLRWIRFRFFLYFRSGHFFLFLSRSSLLIAVSFSFLVLLLWCFFYLLHFFYLSLRLAFGLVKRRLIYLQYFYCGTVFIDFGGRNFRWFRNKFLMMLLNNGVVCLDIFGTIITHFFIKWFGWGRSIPSNILNLFLCWLHWLFILAFLILCFFRVVTLLLKFRVLGFFEFRVWACKLSFWQFIESLRFFVFTFHSFNVFVRKNHP